MKNYKNLMILYTLLLWSSGTWALEEVDGFYRIGTVEDLTAFAEMVNNGDNVNAQLTADIDFTGWEGTFQMIGNSTHHFAGIFDGQYHTITLNVTSTSDNCGLFQYASGTIKNLHIDGTINSSHKFTSGVCAQSYAATFENIISSVTINSSMSGDAGIGGVIARNSAAGTVINNCLINFTLNGESATHVAGIIGWTASSAKISNCLSIPTMNCGSTDTYIIARNPSNAFCSNVYFNNEFGAMNGGCTLITEEQLASGEVTFMLNGNQSNIQWTQNIGSAPTPIPYPTQNIVYAQGHLSCSGLTTADGTPMVYGNEDTAVRDKHQYENSVCTICGATQPDGCDLVDGFYQIGDITQLLWFANTVNNGQCNINAQLTADIDFTGWDGTFPMIGNSGNIYAGIFDGQGHTITLNMTSTSENCGLFQYASGTIKNLHIDGTINSSHKFTSGVCAQSYAATFENIISSVTINSSINGDAGVGGIVARNSASGTVIKNCLINFTLNGETATNVAGIIGWTASAASISNCLSIPTMICGSTDTYIIARNPGNAACTNVYFNEEFGALNDGCTLITEEQLASGEVAYLLNGNQSNIQWTQNIGEDAIPYPNTLHKQVYTAGNLTCSGWVKEGDEISFSNTKQDIPDHHFVNGICTECGITEPGMCEEIDGFYQIGTPEQMAWFARKVNAGENAINAVLTDDITLPADFPVFATSSNKYSGTFDGQFHTITIDLTATDANYGLFRALSGTIKNLHLDGNFNAAFNRSAPLVGELFGGTLDNIWCSVEVAATFTGDSAISGMVGRGSGSGSVLRNCIFTGNIEGMTSFSCAALVGWTADGLNYPATTLTNCAFTGTITVDESQGSATVLARNNGVLLLTNCYYVNPYGTVNSNTTQITAEQVSDGTLAAMLNSGQDTPSWFQELGQDECPVPFSSHPQVYTVCGISGNAHTEAAFNDFSNNVYESQADYCENVLAQKSLVEEYSQAISVLKDANNIDELKAVKTKIEELRNVLLANEAAYSAYAQKVEDTKLYLEEHDDFSGSKRDELTDYLNEFEEPGDLFSFGSATYIMEERFMTIEEIKNETKKIDLWLNEAIAEIPQSGTDLTLLLTNPTFADGSNGWTGAKGFASSTSKTSSLIGAECNNATMDMYQTLTGLQNGIYELRVNGAFRPYPYEDYYNTNYAAMLYLNDVHNYFQADIEDMVSVDDAVDGYNCHITGDYPDYIIQDIEGNVIGYTMRGTIGVANAIQADRYPNSVLCEVTDGTLKVGISQPGTGQQPEWLGFGNLKLIYHGTMEEATVGLDNTLASMTARANTLVNTYVPSSGEDYATYPNFSQALKDELTATMAAVENTSDNAAKYALVQKFSDLFLQVYDCKKAYKSLLPQNEILQDLAVALGDVLTNEEVDELNNTMEYIQTAYMDGLASIEEAQKDYTINLSFIPENVDGFYQISDLKHLIWFAYYVNGGNKINAQLTSDIDFTGWEGSFPMIGNSSHYFAGIFDGQYHTITLDMTSTSENCGLFQYASGTIKNLHIDGTIYSGHKFTSGVCAQSYAATFENIISSVTINSSVTGDAGIGGVVARNSAAGTVIKNCLINFTIEGEAASNVAGIIGWTAFAASISNCLSIPTVNCASTDNYVIARNPNNAICSNVYFNNEFGALNNGCTLITEEQLASGEIAFLLNGNQSDIQWTQTIGTDPAPVPFPTQSTVYAQGNLTCSGLATADGSPMAYGNEDTATREEHKYENGTCAVCGAPQPDVCELVDGFYQIGDITQLVWFANKVNAGENLINAQLTADIDFSAWEGTFPMIGNSSNYFAGIFDGQYHTITVKLTSTSDNCGLFQYASGTIKNLRVDGIIISSHKFTSGVCAQSYAATFENIISSVTINSSMSGDAGIGGVVARNSAAGTVIKNCLINFTINGEAASDVGGIIGWTASAASISNCLSIPEFKCSSTESYTIARNPGNAACNNVFFNAEFGGLNDGSTLITEEQLANGEVLALLNEGQEVAQWTQKEGQAYPTPFPASTGIEEIVVSSANKNNSNAIYNLMGQKVQKAQKGIYIIGGKKVLVK